MYKKKNIGARLDRLPNSSWHIKMWLVTAFALLVCWSNGIGGAVQNILLNEIHWLEPGSKLLAMWGTIYTTGQLFGALIGGPIGDKIGRKKSILLYEIVHIIAMIGGALSPNVYVLYVFRLIQGLGLGALLLFYLPDSQSMYPEEIVVHGQAVLPLLETGHTLSVMVSRCLSVLLWQVMR